VSASIVALRAVDGDGPARSGWPAVVAAAVRTEFRSLAIYGHPGDPVLFGSGCPVAGCVHRQRGGHGLCAAHARQYRNRASGRDVATWLAAPGHQGGPR
jgi:hypothetical protein